MTAPGLTPLPLRIVYEAFDPLALSQDPDVIAEIKERPLDVREESRILQTGRDCYDRLRRYISETNRKGEAAPLVSAEAIATIPKPRLAFVPKDRLYIEADRHDQVFNSDPLAQRAKRPGTIFSAETNLTQVVANFDLRPFVEGFVRRLSATMPDHVWQIGSGDGARFYIRANGFRLNKETNRFETRRYPVPKSVVDCFGPMKVVPPPPVCGICKKQDEKVALQPDPKMREAHGECLK